MAIKENRVDLLTVDNNSATYEIARRYKEVWLRINGCYRWNVITKAKAKKLIEILQKEFNL